MKYAVFLCSLVAVVPFYQAIEAGEAEDKDLADLQGVWRIREEIFEEVGDKPLSKEEIQKWRWIIKGNKLTNVSAGQKPDEESFTIHSKRNPKWIDITTTARIEHFDENDPKVTKLVTFEKWTLYGIYQLEGNTLKVCMPLQQTGWNLRPPEFTAKKGSGCVVYILDREPIKKMPPP